MKGMLGMQVVVQSPIESLYNQECSEILNASLMLMALPVLGQFAACSARRYAFVSRRYIVAANTE
ncbi:hypothetical protein [Pararhizobium sp.]|uniref:hypothetical protein n=1 Tax=Pararhizobium sp. TaxID=1977563 RepID=UPI002718871C|nr:hypothetical protein [Pararhizobium sp.]MDO9415365.1 hypothetical protein [Pararhizobium sp.]